MDRYHVSDGIGWMEAYLTKEDAIKAARWLAATNMHPVTVFDSMCQRGRVCLWHVGIDGTVTAIGKGDRE
jgi:hypothetical protein